MALPIILSYHSYVPMAGLLVGISSLLPLLPRKVHIIRDTCQQDPEVAECSLHFVLQYNLRKKLILYLLSPFFFQGSTLPYALHFIIMNIVI